MLNSYFLFLVAVIFGYIVNELEMSVLDGAARKVSWHVLGFLICFGGVAYSLVQRQKPKRLG